MMISSLPDEAGVYKFLDNQGTVIYVGKAKSLRKRVASYFVKSTKHSAKVKLLVKKVVHIKYIIANNEQDALLLENSLIKELQPRYNILLKDDKSYPWIVVKREPFPRVLSTRELKRDGSQYFGPYGSISVQRAVLEFINDTLPLRTCKLNLSPEAIARGRYSACLQYHIGNCNAPCVGEQNEEEYAHYLSLAKSVLKGDLRPVKKYLETEMYRASDELRFEIAQKYKQRLDMLERYQHRSVVVSSKIEDCDVFSLYTDELGVSCCNYLRIRHGSIVGIYTSELAASLYTEPEDILASAIVQIVERNNQTLSQEVIVPYIPTSELLFDGVTFTVPKRGEKLDLLNFSLKSARLYRAERVKNMSIKNPQRHTDRLMEAMKRELRLDKEPRYIECFDNSNLQGKEAVAACVVFRDGKPSKREYRKFNIKTVEGADDFATMREVVFRRYAALLQANAPLPDLVIVDGGKGQLSSAYSILCELGIENDLPIIGLAKRIEEVFYPNDPNPYFLSRTGEPLKVICYLRDEAHRFGITFHRSKREKNLLTSSLDNIKGIGSKTRDTLLKHFRSVSKIEKAPLSALTKVVGASKAQLLRDYFESEGIS